MYAWYISFTISLSDVKTRGLGAQPPAGVRGDFAKLDVPERI